MNYAVITYPLKEGLCERGKNDAIIELKIVS